MNKQKLIEIAKQMIAEDGLLNLSRSGICKRADIPDGSFAHRAGMSFSDFLDELPKESLGKHPVKKSRVNPKMRRDQLLESMTNLCLTYDYDQVSRKDLADHCGVSLGLINHYFGTLQQVRNAIIRYAVKNDITKIIDRGIKIKDKRAIKK